MSLLAAFTAHEVTTQLRSARFRVLAFGYAVIGAIPAAVVYLGANNVGYRIDAGAYAEALRAVHPALTALLATVLAVDAITREREEGSFGVVSLAPVSASGYVFRRWLALLAIALPLTLLPTLIASALLGHGEGRVPDLAPLAWEWLLRVIPPLVVMSALMLALGTITNRTLLAILAYGAAMTFGLGFLQDLLAMVHRKLDGPGDMIGFDPMAFARLMWVVRGWWQFDPPTATGYPIERELDRLLPEAALIVGCTLFFLGVAPAFLRRTRPDVRPWRIRDDHPLRTMLRGVNRIRENYRPDAGLQPADRVALAIALIASIACFAWLLRRETHFATLAAARLAAESAKEPRHMSTALVAKSIAIEGHAGRAMKTRATYAFENRGDATQSHLGFMLHHALTIERVTASCANAKVTRAWERVGVDLDKPIAPRATCAITFTLTGTPDAVVFNLGGRGRFGDRFRQWQAGTKSIELSDLSRSTFVPAATRSRLMLKAADLAPVPRYTPWRVDYSPVNSDRDVTSFVPEVIAPRGEIRVAVTLPGGFTATDSCGTIATNAMQSRCTLGFAEYRLFAMRAKTMPLAGRATLVHLSAHGDLARLHAPAIGEAITLAESAWPGLRLGGAPVFLERPIDGDGERAYWYQQRASLVTASGSLYAIPEWLFIRRKPVETPRIAAAIIGGTLRGRRVVLPSQARLFTSLFDELAAARVGAGESRSAVIPGKGPPPDTEPLLRLGYSEHAMRRLRAVLVDLENRAGADRIVEGVNEFSEAPGTGNAEELIAIIGRRANVNLDNFYSDYFEDRALPKLTIEDAKFVRDGRRWVVRGFARNLAKGESFVPMVLRTQFGSVRQIVKVGSGERVPFELTTDYEPRTLQLDPDRVVYRWAAVGTVDSIDFRGES